MPHPLPPSRAVLRPLILLCCLVVVLTGLSMPTAEASGRTPPMTSSLPTRAEGLARYVPNNACHPGNRPGTERLARLLQNTYQRPVGTARICNGSVSEHHDGRAVDLMVSVRFRSQKADAAALNHWLLATDAHGNQFANARRLGVMYIIWDNKIWASYRSGDGWREYAGCSKRTSRTEDTTCHRDHIHISLSHEGAAGRTSFWSRKVAGQRWGACVAAGRSWAPAPVALRGEPCPATARPTAPTGSSSTHRALLPWSGMDLRAGIVTGTPVRAWQQGLGVPVTGTFDAATTAATRELQRAARLPQSGSVDADTWTAMLQRHAPKQTQRR